MEVSLNKNWNPQQFNTNFNRYLRDLNRKNKQQKRNEENAMDINIRERTISEYTFSELLKEWKYSLLNMLNNILHLKVNKETFTQGNTLFYLGITILIFVILYYLFYSLYLIIKPNNIQKIIYEHHYNYQ